MNSHKWKKVTFIIEIKDSNNKKTNNFNLHKIFYTSFLTLSFQATLLYVNWDADVGRWILVTGTFSGGLGTTGSGSTAPKNSDDSSTVTILRNIINQLPQECCPKETTGFY